MTTPTKAAIEAARERLAKAAEAEGVTGSANSERAGCHDDCYENIALATALQEMSDAVKGVVNYLDANSGSLGYSVKERLAPFILPDPVVDPLVEAMSEAMCGVPGEDYAKPAADLRDELAKRGLQIVPVRP